MKNFTKSKWFLVCACLSLLLLVFVGFLSLQFTDGVFAREKGKHIGSLRSESGIAIRSKDATDEAMARFFIANKVHFERLVHLYQTDERRTWQYEKGSLTPFETDEYKGLLQKLSLTALSDDSSLWLNEPYSSDMPSRAKGLNGFTAYQYHGIFFYTDRSKFAATDKQLGRLVWKEYFYVPQPPLIKDKEMWWPRSPYNGDLYRKSPVEDSLDEYPAKWTVDLPQGSQTECVYKKIEIQWFLRLCKS